MLPIKNFNPFAACFKTAASEGDASAAPRRHGKSKPLSSGEGGVGLSRQGPEPRRAQLVGAAISGVLGSLVPEDSWINHSVQIQSAVLALSPEERGHCIYKLFTATVGVDYSQAYHARQLALKACNGLSNDQKKPVFDAIEYVYSEGYITLLESEAFKAGVRRA